MKQLIQPHKSDNSYNVPAQLFMEKPDDKNLPKETPTKQDEPGWPEDDVAEKYIKGGGKKETPSEEDDEEAQRTLREAKEPKK